MSRLLAVNVLLEPDPATQERARRLNGLLREDATGGGPGDEPPPAGFAFDQTHLPHVTLLQRYVRQEDVEPIAGALDRAVAGAAARALRLRAGDLAGGRLGTPPGTLLASVEFRPQAPVRALHEAVLCALEPFAVRDGEAAAFFTLPGEQPPGQATVAYVRDFAERSSGAHYAPHLTAGVARETLIAQLARDHPLARTRLAPVAVALAHLGDLGTARDLLWRRPLA
jgi:hypothetical protein